MDTHTTTHVTTLVPAHVGGHDTTPVLPADLRDKVQDLRTASKSENTRRAYRSDWNRWQTWCQAHGFEALPAHPDTVSAYLADHAGVLSVATLSRHLATVAKAHQLAGVANPCRETTVRDTVAGLRRTHGAPPAEAPGLMADELGATLDTLCGSLADVRDRALLLVGWCAGLRRSELAGLTWGDITPDPGGYLLTLRHAKTDNTGEGQQVGLAKSDNPARCPVLALDRWRDAVAHERTESVQPGAPVFVTITRWGKMGTQLSGHAVALIVQRRTREAGLSITYRGHSLRKGLVQTAFLAGVSDSQVMATTRHKSVVMLRRYQGQAGLVSRSASRGLLA